MGLADPTGPSKTFTIDIAMPADDDITDSLEALRLTHEQALNMLAPDVSEGDDDEEEQEGYDYDQEMMMTAAAGGDYDWLDQASVSGVGSSSVLSHASSLPVGASALSTPPSSVVTQAQAQSRPQGEGQGDGPKAKSRTLASLRLQPQFNLDSAGKLLETFRGLMLNHFHCVVVREEDTVAGMAKERPFVLLAVLAAASGSRTLQGHSLYDEEFRKVLGLKYPFHLRPKNKQAVQYIRMVVDIISDLELDDDPGTDSIDVPPAPERLDQIRLYLASYYLVSAFASTWGRSPSLTYTDYTARCCDLLQAHSPLHGDHVLAWQVRLQRLIEETNDLRRTQRGQTSQSEYQINLMIRGMETQLTEWETRMAPRVADTPSIRIAVLFTRVFLSGAPLLKLPSLRAGPLPRRPAPPGLGRPALHALYDYLLALDPAEVNSFIGIEWGALILAVILASACRSRSRPCARSGTMARRGAIRFGEYVDRFCRMGGGVDAAEIRAGLQGAGRGAGGSSTSTSGGGGGGAQEGRRSMDVLSASKIVLEMVKKKYLRRVAKLEQQQQHKQQQNQQRDTQMEALLAAAAAAPHPMPPRGPSSSSSSSTRSGRGTSYDPAVSGCPMMDGSLEPYYPYWDETFTAPLAMASAFATAAPPPPQVQQQGAGMVVDGPAGLADGGVGVGMGVGVGVGADPAGVAALGVLPNDLWTAMTMGWAAQGDVDFEGL
ncbi:hypothetical protein NEMBOFW57_001885 [Staphylotrichum longicolle]|uniref:Uncharacterized protein n=1 Tax=Staphylotrichum longicolle TaxID=669026 RepID=A0AAD4F6X7_9PEZI|nr:hypothetical protein NEMBOFW57_001885 [Staphylotrichum longicolle]